MDDKAWLDWIGEAGPLQFTFGVIILVFGTQKILSADNLEKSLSGMFLPVKWLHKKRRIAAQREVSAAARLQKENEALQRELSRYHSWSLQATRKWREAESSLAAAGIELEPPAFVYLHKFTGDGEAEDDDDEDH